MTYLGLSPGLEAGPQQHLLRKEVCQLLPTPLDALSLPRPCAGRAGALGRMTWWRGSCAPPHLVWGALLCVPCSGGVSPRNAAIPAPAWPTETQWPPNRRRPSKKDQRELSSTGSKGKSESVVCGSSAVLAESPLVPLLPSTSPESRWSLGFGSRLWRLTAHALVGFGCGSTAAGSVGW